MKLNWGTGIVIAFVLFIAFIMYFVYTVNTDKRYDHELVTEEYYKKELDFEAIQEKEQRSADAGYSIRWKKDGAGLSLSFPEAVDPVKISGTVMFYRPSSSELDFEWPISFEEEGKAVLIPDNRLLEGRWNIVLDWSYNGEAYYNKLEIVY